MAILSESQIFRCDSSQPNDNLNVVVKDIMSFCSFISTKMDIVEMTGLHFSLEKVNRTKDF